MDKIAEKYNCDKDKMSNSTVSIIIADDSKYEPFEIGKLCYGKRVDISEKMFRMSKEDSKGQKYDVINVSYSLKNDLGNEVNDMNYASLKVMLDIYEELNNIYK